jgi:hypothetical protein
MQIVLLSILQSAPSYLLKKHELVMYSHFFIILLCITCAIVTESLSN